MMRAVALIFGICLGIGTAMAADDEPAALRAGAHHRLAPPRAVRDFHLAAVQAQNPPDTIAANCYQELVTVVQSPAINPLPSGPGAFQLFQKARDLKNLVAAMQSNNGPLQALNIACAPLVIDVQTTLIRLGVIGGAVAATGGLFPIPPP